MNTNLLEDDQIYISYLNKSKIEFDFKIGDIILVYDEYKIITYWENGEMVCDPLDYIPNIEGVKYIFDNEFRLFLSYQNH